MSYCPKMMKILTNSMFLVKLPSSKIKHQDWQLVLLSKIKIVILEFRQIAHWITSKCKQSKLAKICKVSKSTWWNWKIMEFLWVSWLKKLKFKTNSFVNNWFSCAKKLIIITVTFQPKTHQVFNLYNLISLNKFHKTITKF